MIFSYNEFSYEGKMRLIISKRLRSEMFFFVLYFIVDFNIKTKFLRTLYFLYTPPYYGYSLLMVQSTFRFLCNVPRSDVFIIIFTIKFYLFLSITNLVRFNVFDFISLRRIQSLRLLWLPLLIK